MKLQPLNILFIEDNRTDVILTREVLNRAKIINQLNVIDNGEDALSYLKKRDISKKFIPPDLIILDLKIPKRDGFEVLSEIAQDRDLNRIPLIVYTTSDLTSETLQKYKLDSRQYVKKSLDFKELIGAIKFIEERDGKFLIPSMSASDGLIDDHQLNILLVEDNMEDVELIEELMFMEEKGQWSMKRCERLSEAFEYLKYNGVDVAILDLFLPDMRGLETLKKFVAYNHTIPIIVMTSLHAKQLGREAIREGAQDYLIKGQFTSDHFIRAVEFSIERKKLDQLRDELLSYVSHELSNPLTVVKDSIAQIAEGVVGGINDKQKHFLDISLSNIGRLIMITEDLLLCTKLELGKLPIHKELFDMNALVKEVIETYRASFMNKKLNLECFLSTQPVMVSADKERIGQVVTNLLNNALKFTFKGHVQIAVARNDHLLWCVVKDTGQGIPQEDIPKLFKKYQQVLSHRRKGVKGTGLGLFICKTLVELHGGHIWVKSCLGEGTEITFSLPIQSKEVMDNV
ncbi:MAG: response regulator [Candidatus Omnitrophica bacterium]|nr:response regulator [Candidatus Omnitrophota bacterium]